MLLARSQVFRVMLFGPQWLDSVQREIRLEEPEECESVIEDFLRYFYTGQIDLSIHSVIPVLILANKYNVKDLEKSCEQYASGCIFSGTPMEQVFEWLTISKQLNLHLLNRKCREYMLLNFDLTMKTDGFLDFELNEIKWFLSCSDLIVSSEYHLYHAILDWVNHESRVNNYVENLKELTPYLRFCMMSTEELVKVEAELSQEDKAVIVPHLFKAFKYHAIPMRNRVSGTDSISREDKPRLYTGMENGIDPAICTTLYLHQSDFRQLSNGVKRAVNLPVSMSHADRQDTREWFLSFHKNEEETINLEVSSTDTTSKEIGTVEASVLIYKQVNNITFVKGVMQFRCYTRVLANSPNSSSRVGHIFSVVVPADALQPNSPYQIKQGSDSRCMFKLIMRNFEENLSEIELSNPPKSLESSTVCKEPEVLVKPQVENIGTKLPETSNSSVS